MAIVEGIAVSGEFVERLKDKRFAVATAPHYEEMPDMDNPEQKVRKLKMKIVVYETRDILDYYPNNTSIKTIAEMWGYEMDNWVGKILEWEVIQQKVRTQTRKVLFVKQRKIDEILPNETKSS
jgi:hypothetical protein